MKRFKFGHIRTGPVLAHTGASAPTLTAAPRNTAIASHSTPTSDSAWDAGANEKRLKSDQPASYYKKMYAWKDSGEDGTKKSQYKFPHHMVSDSGDIGAANIKACQSIIGALNGARTKPDIAAVDRKGVYAHAAKHLKDAGIDPAPLNEIKEQAQMKVKVKNKVNNGGTPTPAPHSTAAPFFAAAVRPDGALELAIYTMIGNAPWWSDEEGITVATIKSALDAAPQCSSICLRINSPGGDVFQGVAILNILRSQSKPVTVMVDGIAASAASVIAMAGSKVLMGSGAAMMIHQAWGGCMGNSEDMNNMMNRLSMIDKCIATTYVERTRLTEDDVLGMMKAETWMSAQDCINHGFATGMQAEGTDQPSPQIKAQLPVMVKAFKSKVETVNARMRNDRGVLAAAMAGIGTGVLEMPTATDPDGDADDCDCNCANCQDGDCEDCTNQNCDDDNCEDCPMQKADAKALGYVPAGSGLPVLMSRFQSYGHAEMPMGNNPTAPILAFRSLGVGTLSFMALATPSITATDIITGTLAPYNSPSCDLGGFVEVYERGCFSDYLNTDDPRVCLNHNLSQLLGRKSSGTARFTDTVTGLNYDCDLPDTQAAHDLKSLLARGDIRESSAAFFILEKRLEVRGGVRTRVVTKARLVEGGPHVFAAYSDSTVSSVLPEVADQGVTGVTGVDNAISDPVVNPIIDPVVNSPVTDDTIQNELGGLELLNQTLELLKIA